MLNSYQDLKVWQKSIDLVVEVYSLTKFFPKEELYITVSQIRRAAISIPSNIAEGYSRKNRPEYLQFLRIALSSASELETQLIIVKKLKFVTEDKIGKIEEMLKEILRMLNALINSLSSKP